MRIAMTRRAILGASGGLMLGGLAPANLKGLEKLAGGRLGFALLDTATGQISGHRLDERFAMCSTFKLALAGLILRAAAAGELDLNRQIPIQKKDILSHAPKTKPMVGKSLSIRDLSEAAQKTSDNTAANLLLHQIGGPAGFTKRLRSLGDSVTRLDRFEPDLNDVKGSDQRDTTSPRAMAKTVSGFAVGDWLTKEDSALLTGWMVETSTGQRRLRAATPPGWRAGNKTGTGYAPGRPNRVNDLAVFWPPNTAPLVVAAFYEAPGYFPHIRPEDEAVLAQAMEIAIPINLKP